MTNDITFAICIVMNPKRADSLRTLGFVTIATDKPTREKLKVAAEAANMTLAEYMRLLADASLNQKQGGLPELVIKSKPDAKRIEALSMQAIEISKVIPMSDSRRTAICTMANRHIMFEDYRHALILFEKMSAELEAYQQKVASNEVTQLELELNEG